MKRSELLRFRVRREEPQLITPCKATPKHVLYLSNIDDQPGLRVHDEGVQFFGRNLSKHGCDPRKVIKNALTQLLVDYYPVAGRLRDAENGKLCVDCNGEGIVFIEAEADVRLCDFGELKPPFPCWEELLYDVPQCRSITNAPLLLVQVTVLKCGGFIFASKLSHVISDGTGFAQFLAALSELCHGASAPSLQPVWSRRKLLGPRQPPSIHVALPEYDDVGPTCGHVIPDTDMVKHSFVLSDGHMARIRSLAGPTPRRRLTWFDATCAWTWQAMIRALGTHGEKEEEARLLFMVDARRRLRPPPAAGYYGNVLAFACVRAPAAVVAEAPVSHVASMVHAAKRTVCDEYVRSVVDLMELRGRPPVAASGHRTLLVSDVTALGLAGVDFGWGPPVYGGTTLGNHGKNDVDGDGGTECYFNARARGDGAGILMCMYLPASAVAAFQQQLDSLLTQHHHLPSVGLESRL